MSHPVLIRVVSALLPLATLAAAPTARAEPPGAPATAAAEAPPPAPVFDGWVIKNDLVVPREKIGAIESHLDGKIRALRNVVYDVKGKTIQINVIVAGDPTDAEKIYRALTKIKPAWAVARKAVVLYELVGKNESMDDMKKAHDRLAAP